MHLHAKSLLIFLFPKSLFTIGKDNCFVENMLTLGTQMPNVSIFTYNSYLYQTYINVIKFLQSYQPYTRGVHLMWSQMRLHTTWL